MRPLSLLLLFSLPTLYAFHSGGGKSNARNDKKNFLADAMREMGNGGKSLNIDSVVRKVPNVIKVVMRPEIPPKHRYHRRHQKKILNRLLSILRLAKGLNTRNRESRKNKTEPISAKRAFQETMNLLESINGRLENMSNSRNNGFHKIMESYISSKSDRNKGTMFADSFSLLPDLRSMVQHGKTFNPDATRAAFARAKKIVWDSVGRDPVNTDVRQLNNSKLSNAVTLLEMAVKEAEKMQENKTEYVDKGKSEKGSQTNKTITSFKKLAHAPDAHQLEIFKELLFKELKLENSTNNHSGILISDIPFPKQRHNKDGDRRKNLPNAEHNYSSARSNERIPISETQALLGKYNAFITNILKAAHQSVMKNLTGEQNSTRLKLHQSYEHPVKIPEMNFSNAAKEQKQEKQSFQPPVLSKERLEARKAFGTARKLVKAFLARQELYKAEKEFFKKIHDMLDQSSLHSPLTSSPLNDEQESTVMNQLTSSSPTQSPRGQSPVNAVSATSVGDGKPKQPSEAQKKFEEAAHLEEKVAAQQDEMYDALMGHTIGAAKGYGGFDEEGTVRETPEQDGVEDAYNLEDYGDFKDSDEEAERRFYHDHSQGDFEAKARDDESFSLRSKIRKFRNMQFSSNTELSGSGSNFQMTGDSKGRDSLGRRNVKDLRHVRRQQGQSPRPRFPRSY
ncbi:uncharacterized protein [Montipora capricornis]|uniref:uncharacterized protein n=1 Tax=Montipora capricornis TaxID=246305 RepID=UPI0035F104FA